MPQPGRIAEPQDCFAAEIFDDSADVDFAHGSVLFCAGLRDCTSRCAPASGGGSLPNRRRRAEDARDFVRDT
jgi:hypothetical protein